MGWNHKSEKAGWLLLLFFPAIPMLCAILFPFIHQSPILACILFGVIFVFGFIVIWKRTGKKDKQE
jgi:hypothetical protein